MDRNIILCIGSVTAKQYGRARPDLLRQGFRHITVTHVKPRAWLCANIIEEETEMMVTGQEQGVCISGTVLRDFFVPIYLELGPQEFRSQLDSGGWLEWFVCIRPSEVRAIVLGPESDFDIVYDESVYNIVQRQIAKTWPNGIDVYVIGEDDKAFKDV